MVSGQPMLWPQEGVGASPALAMLLASLAVISLLTMPTAVVGPTAHITLKDAVGNPCSLVIEGQVLRGPGDDARGRSDTRLLHLAARFAAEGFANALVEIKVAGRKVHVRADGDGDFAATVFHPSECTRHPGLHTVTARLLDRPDQSAEVARAFALVVDDRASVRLAVSDIDDTLLVSDVTRPPLVAMHTLLEAPVDRRPVVGAPQIMSALANRGVHVVYVSASPEILRRDLRRFLATHGFPPGPVLLRSSALTPLRGYKARQLEMLASVAPHGGFILFGDDGQQDPEIYDRFMNSHPQPARAWIHQVRKGRRLPGDGSRMKSFRTYLDVQDQIIKEMDGSRVSALHD